MIKTGKFNVLLKLYEVVQAKISSGTLKSKSGPLAEIKEASDIAKAVINLDQSGLENLKLCDR